MNLGIKLIVGGIIITIGFLVQTFFSSPLSTKVSQELFPVTPTPIPIEGQERQLTPIEQSTMSGSFEKEFKAILASPSGK